MNADDVLATLQLLADAGTTTWVDGGWGVDALLGETSRAHADLDLVVSADDLPAARTALANAGFDRIRRDWLPTTLAVADETGREVDLHPVSPTPDGGGDQRLPDGGMFHYPPPVAGTIGGRAVRCVDARTQVLCHLGYEPTEKDRSDMGRLARLGITLPEPYRANAGEAAVWDGPAGDHRVKFADMIEAQVRRPNERFLSVAAVGARDRVLDIGCGTGQSTRDAARAAVDGSVVAVDLSEAMLALARRLSDEQGLRNVTFLRADAQTHEFPAASFDLCVSRFGSMFFDDPVAAFTNIGRALRPGARLVLLVWQDRDHNEWSTAIRAALGGPVPAPPLTGPNPFSLADPVVAEGILAAAGFVDFATVDVREPVFYGRNSEIAYDFALGFPSTRDLLTGLDAPTTASALERLRATLAAHDTGDGVSFDSRAWVITARRALDTPG
jgi:SAM-dependent methyltransferase